MTNQNIVFAASVALLLAIAGWWYWSQPFPDIQIAPSEARGKALELVERMKKIEIDTSFLDDQEFSSLESAPKPSFEGRERGRPNPFLSLPRTRGGR